MKEGRIVTAQTLSGTGSLRVAAEFLANFYPNKTILVCQPTWGNHNKIFPKGGLAIKPYRYYDARTKGLDIEGMLADLGRAERGAVVLLHACAHNPTGVDPTQEQWRRILQVCQQQQLLCLFDSAYQVRAALALVHRSAALPSAHPLHCLRAWSSQGHPSVNARCVVCCAGRALDRGLNSASTGNAAKMNEVRGIRTCTQGFASGCLDKDAFSLRLFLDAGAPMLLAQSFAKNMGLYGERTGALHVVCASPEEAKRVESQVKGVIRPMYSSPPRHGAAIAAAILGDDALMAEWRQELKHMADRINAMRQVRCLRALWVLPLSGRWQPHRERNGVACAGTL